MKHGSNFRQPQHRKYYIARSKAEQLRHQNSKHKERKVSQPIFVSFILCRLYFLVMFDNQFDSLYDGSKICIQYAAVKSCQTALEQLFLPEKNEMWLQRRERQIAGWIVTTTCNQTVINYITLGLHQQIALGGHTIHQGKWKPPLSFQLPAGQLCLSFLALLSLPCLMRNS